MKARIRPCASGLIVAAACWLVPLAVDAQVYRWTDESGTVHIADDLNSVPERYRAHAERIASGLGGTARTVPLGRDAPPSRPAGPAERWQGRTLAQWEADLREPAPRARTAAVAALGFFGAPAVPALAGALRDADAQVRVGAARALGQIGPGARDAVTALVQALRDGEARVRFDAAVALGRIGPAAGDAVPALGALLRDPAGEVRVGAAMGLGGIGPAAQETVPALAQALRDPNVVLRMSAASALAGIGPAAKAAVPALVQALRDGNTSVRSSAAAALGQIGPEARDAVGELRRLAESDPGQDMPATGRDGVLRQKEALLRQELRTTAREAIRQIEGR